MATNPKIYVCRIHFSNRLTWLCAKFLFESWFEAVSCKANVSLKWFSVVCCACCLVDDTGFYGITVQRTLWHSEVA